MKQDPDLLAALDEYAEDQALDAAELKAAQDAWNEYDSKHDPRMGTGWDRDEEQEQIEEGAFIAGVMLDGEPAPDPWADLYADFEHECPECGQPSP